MRSVYGMLCIVDLTDNRNRFFERFRKHNIDFKRAEINGSQPVFLIRSHSRYSDFSALKNVISRCGKALFVNGHIPDGFETLAFKAQVLPLKMLVETAVGYFKLLPRSSQKITVTVFDKNACACSETAALCRYVRSVRIITDNIKAYKKCASAVFESCGACMFVSGSSYAANKSDIVIAADDLMLQNIEFSKAVVFKKHTQKPNVYELNDCRKSIEIPGLNDAGIDNFTLMCALFEECGYKLNSIPVFYGAEVFKKS